MYETNKYSFDINDPNFDSEIFLQKSFKVWKKKIKKRITTYCYLRLIKHVFFFCFYLIIQEYSLKQIMNLENEIVKDTASLHSDMQTLVYENYNKFISATDTVRKV